MMIRPSEFGMVQQMNSVANINQNENNRPQAEQMQIMQNTQKETDDKAEQVQQKDTADNTERGFDAKDKSDNEYYTGEDGKNRKKSNSDGRFFIKGQGSSGLDIKV